MRDTVSSSRGMAPNPEMSLFGYLMAALLLVLLLPLLPFLVLAWLAYQLLDRRREPSDDGT